MRGIRKALGMSGAQLASRLKLSRNRVSVLERREVSGDTTINQLREAAAQLGCDGSYALVPKKNIPVMLDKQAEKLATCVFRYKQPVISPLCHLLSRNFLDRFCKTLCPLTFTLRRPS